MKSEGLLDVEENLGALGSLAWLVTMGKYNDNHFDMVSHYDRSTAHAIPDGVQMYESGPFIAPCRRMDSTAQSLTFKMPMHQRVFPRDAAHPCNLCKLQQLEESMTPQLVSS